MMRQLTQEEAEKKTKECRLTLVGSYVNNRTKTTFQCFCGNTFNCTPASVFSRNTKSCGCINHINKSLSQTAAERKTSKLSGLFLFGTYTCSKSPTEFMCRCGNIFVARPNDVWSHKTLSCGCIRSESHTITQELAENTSCAIGIDMVGPYQGSHNPTYFKCPNCNRMWLARPGNIWSGKIKKCGNCNLMRNGKNTSQIAIDFQKTTDKILNIEASPNHRVELENRTVYIDIAYPAHNIAIEYDEWYWHKDKLEDDLERPEEVLQKSINELLNGSNSETITTENWEKAQGQTPRNTEILPVNPLTSPLFTV